MTLLIVGGMLVIALLAILGAVFLSRTDQRAVRAQTNGNITVSTQGALPLAQQSSVASPAPERAAPLTQNQPPTAERHLSPRTDNQEQFMLNGQFHELSVELQTLYQHAYELERRLRTLSEIADRIEKTQGEPQLTD